VFGIDADLIRLVGVGVLKEPVGIACSALDELVVADTGDRGIVVLSDVGELLMTFGSADFSGVTLHGSTLWAPTSRAPAWCSRDRVQVVRAAWFRKVWQ
jgi:hypothetical protein